MGSMGSGGALVILDRALELTRRTQRAELLRACGPGALLSLLALALYYMERVEGVRSLRGLFALLFLLAYLWRAVVLARWAGRRVAELLTPYRIEAVHGKSSAIVRAALWVAVDLWFWLWFLVLAVHIDPWFVPLLLPLFAVRGALLPAWLACGDATQDASGFVVLRRAMEQVEGRRVTGIGIELCLLLAALGIGLNLLALGAGLVSVGQDMLGLDLSLVNAFLSHKNYFALLFILALSLTLVEPLRAAVSAILFSDALLSREGIAVRSLVVKATEPKPRFGRGHALLALLVATAFASRLEAQAAPPTHEPMQVAPDATVVVPPGAFEHEANEYAAEEEPCEGSCARARERDEQVRARVRTILAEPVFAEFPEADWSANARGKNVFSKWLEELLRWLTEQNEQESRRLDDGLLPSLELPPPAFFIVVALLIALFAAYRMWRGRGEREPEEHESPQSETPLSRPAEAHLEDALALASKDLRMALRSLYLATLVGLSRRSLLTLAPERTNGQYLRELPAGEDKQMFAAFTRIFDAVHYGARTPSPEDFAACRSLAERLITGGGLG